MSIEIIPPLAVVGSASLAYYGMQVNGGMQIAQERTTATLTNTPANIVDQWDFFAIGTATVVASQIAATDAPPGYSHYTRLNVTVAETPLAAASWYLWYDRVEGYRTARLAWGTAPAFPLSMGFWMRSNVAGYSFGVVLRNGNYTRNYTTIVTITTPNVWQWVTLLIPGDVTGTWLTTTDAGLHVIFGVATGTDTASAVFGTWQNANWHGASGTTNLVATAGNTLDFTGFLLVPGNELPSATQAGYIQRAHADELTLCLRYWEKSYNLAVALGTVNSLPGHQRAMAGGSTFGETVRWSVRKRAIPTVTVYNLSTGVAGTVYSNTGSPASAPLYVSETGYVENAVVNIGTSYQWHFVVNARLP